MAEGGANSPVATTGAGDGQESTTASVKPKRTRGKSTGAKPRGKASVYAEALWNLVWPARPHSPLLFTMLRFIIIWRGDKGLAGQAI